MTDGGEVRLGRDGVLVGWVYAAGIAGLVVGACALTAVEGQLSLLGALPAAVAVLVVLLVKLTRLGHDELVLDDIGIVARTRDQERRWRWSEVLEVGVNRFDVTGPYASPGCTVWIRPEGRTFDVPGPNALFPVTIPVFGFRAQRRVREAVQRACTEHGVPFDTRGLRMAMQPRPGSPLRTLPPRSAPRQGGR